MFANIQTINYLNLVYYDFDEKLECGCDACAIRS